LALRGDRRHRRADTEGARFIACRGDHAAFGRSADGDGLAAQIGIVALFDAGEKRVHIDMDNFADW
jgi:hypothetical protein